MPLPRYPWQLVILGEVWDPSGHDLWSQTRTFEIHPGFGSGFTNAQLEVPAQNSTTLARDDGLRWDDGIHAPFGTGDELRGCGELQADDA